MSEPTLSRDHAVRALIDWYVDAGVTTIEAESAEGLTGWTASPTLRPAPPPALARPIAPAPPPGTRVSSDEAPLPTDEAVAAASSAAAAASTLPELAAAIEAFTGCPLRQGARSTVVYDGVLGAPVLVLGEAPGRDEDRIGKPFVGRAGALLDKMLHAIGHSRERGDGLGDVCITNAIYWRPPGNRTPTKAEIAICLPFVQRWITLSAPQVILMTGNVPTQALFPDAPGITRARGKWKDYALPDGQQIPALPVFHPAFLLRQPAQKRLAWADLLLTAERIGINPA